MISHMKHKPNKEKMLETINQSAKIEFDFLINGLKSDLIEVSNDDVIQLIDKNTKSLKLKVSAFYLDLYLIKIFYNFFLKLF